MYEVLAATVAAAAVEHTTFQTWERKGGKVKSSNRNVFGRDKGGVGPARVQGTALSAASKWRGWCSTSPSTAKQWGFRVISWPDRADRSVSGRLYVRIEKRADHEIHGPRRRRKRR